MLALALEYTRPLGAVRAGAAAADRSTNIIANAAARCLHFRMGIRGIIEFAFKSYVTPPKHATATTVACSPNPDEVGHPTTCTATVTDTSATKTTPTGTVSFAHTNTGSFASESCTLAPTSPPVTGVAACSVTYTPLVTGAHEVIATYGGDATHEASKGSTTVNATAAKCQQGDSDDHNRGDDNDESDGSGARSRLALSGLSQPLLNSVKCDECDNYQRDRDGDRDREGSDDD
jgi:hypothetical protein